MHFFASKELLLTGLTAVRSVAHMTGSLASGCPTCRLVLLWQIGGFHWSLQCLQIEGGWDEGGRTESVWDVWTHTAGKTYQGTTGDVACDHYHRWPQDIQLMKELGMKHYRLVCVWGSRPSGGFL
jgi:hypothetical protein